MGRADGDLRPAARATRSRSSTPRPRSSSPEQAAERVARPRTRGSSAVVVYGHQPSASTQIMTGASAVSTATQASCARRTNVLLLGGHVAALPERTLREEACDFVASGEGLYTLVELVEALRAAATRPRAGPGPRAIATGRRRGATPPAPLRHATSRREMPGVAWDLLPMARYRAHNWHCFGGLDRQPYAAIYTTLGCPYHCSFCCIQAPFKGGEQARRASSRRSNSYRFWSPTRVVDEIDTARQRLRRAQHQDRRRDVRPEPPARPRHLRPHHRARLRPEHLGVRARRHGQGRHARQAEARRVQLAGVRHRGRRRARARRRGQGVRARTRSTTSSQDVKAAGINVIGNYIFGLPEDDRRHDAGDAGPGARPELRVRQLLLGDGLSRLAAVRRRRSARACRCRRRGPATRSTAVDYAAAADAAPAGRRGAALPRPGVRRLLHAPAVSRDGPRRSSATAPSTTSAR